MRGMDIKELDHFKVLGEMTEKIKFIIIALPR